MIVTGQALKASETMERTTPKEVASRLRELARGLASQSALPRRRDRRVMTALLTAYLAGFEHGASRRARLPRPRRETEEKDAA